MGGVIDTADHKIGDLNVAYLSELEYIFETDLANVSGA
jgi:hypothetical protein